MNKLYKRYLEIRKELENLEFLPKERFYKGLASLLITALILSGPLVFLINCLIFHDYNDLIYCGIILIGFLAFIIFKFFYFNGLNENNNIRLKEIFIFEGIIVSIIFVVICLIFLL